MVEPLQCAGLLIKQVTKGMVVHITERILSMSQPESIRTVHHISSKDRICKWPRENNSRERAKGRHSLCRRKNGKFDGGDSSFCVVQWKLC